MNSINFNENIPVAYDVDVVVVGGGPAGVGAAFSAAKSGQSVLVIEQMNCLGGISTAGWHGHLCQYSSWGNPEERVVGGLGHRLCKQMVADGYARYDICNCDFEVEYFKFLLEKESKKLPNLKILYYTQFSEAVVEGSEIKYVIIQNKSGRQAVKAKQFIDCSGDADLAARSGVPFEFGRKSDGATQPMTLMFQLGGVDWNKVSEFKRQYALENPDDKQPYKLCGVFKEAQENGDMKPYQDGIMGWWWTPTRPDQVGINFTHIFGKSCINAEDLTAATIEGRDQAYQTVDVYRKYIPGMENSWMSHTAQLMGTRESRRIIGHHVITEEDILNESEFEDSIGYGSFFIDLHNCTGIGMDKETIRPRKGFKYQIPFRALVPQKIINLLVAGRCISSTHVALGSLRVMPQCMLEGEACGIAASMAINDDAQVADISIKKLQNTLRDNGSIITAEDIKRLKTF
jgi:hypothetical protein